MPTSSQTASADTREKPSAATTQINPGLRALVRPISDLVEDRTNARKHSRRNLDAIRDSLAMHGQQKPIVVSSDLVVRAGNGTLRAARELGWTEIAAVVYDGDLIHAQHFAVADNRTTDLSEWDYEGLASTFKELEKAGLDLAAAGFTAGEVEALVMADWRLPPKNELPAPHERISFQLSGEQREAFLKAKAILAEKEGQELDDHGALIRIVSFFLDAHAAT